jgi:hypothetical protein
MYKMFFLIIILCYTITAQQTVIEEFSATAKGHTNESWEVGQPSSYSNHNQNEVSQIFDGDYNAWVSSRNIYQFDLSSLPSLNYILSCSIKVKVLDTYGNVKFNISELVDGDLSTSAEDKTNMHKSNVNYIDYWQYTDTTIKKYDITDILLSKGQDTKLNIGLQISSEIPFNVTWRAKLEYVKLEIESYLTQDITIQNNFPGGIIKAGIINQMSTQNSPCSLKVLDGSNLEIEAIENQTDNEGYSRIWNDIEAPNELSKWERIVDGNRSFRATSKNYDFTTTSDDSNSIYEAGLRKLCNVTFSNQFSGTTEPGSVKINGVTQTAPYIKSVVEQNNITAEADNHDINGIRYIFRRWSVTETERILNLTVTSHTSKTAEYLGKPIFNENLEDGNLRDLNISSGPGNKVKLSWNEHPHNSVTKYYIYRKIKYPDGSWGNTELLTTRNRGTLSYVDVEYTLRSSVGGYMLFYSVQAYYSLEGTLSGEDFSSAWGDQSGVLTKDNTENNTQELIVTNYDIGNFPNPFNPTTRINYQLPEQGHVTIKVYDMLGKEVAELVNETKESGIYDAEFNASNLSSGVYVYTIQVDAMSETSKSFFMSKKMLMLK